MEGVTKALDKAMASMDLEKVFMRLLSLLPNFKMSVWKTNVSLWLKDGDK